MATPEEELLKFSDRLDALSARAKESQIQKPLESLQRAAENVARAWSGSWIGYHAVVYYQNLLPPPPGHHFSQEWGLLEKLAIDGTVGDWREYDPDDVKKAIYDKAGNPDLTPAQELSKEARQEFEAAKAEIESILSAELDRSKDSYLAGIGERIGKRTVLSSREIVLALKPASGYMTHDSTAAGQGLRAPPHISVLSEVGAIRDAISACADLGEWARRAGSHLSRRRRDRQRAELVGTNVFIGHGRSPDWKDLKDFVKDRLALPYDEFNRVPIAGITNIARLSEMLDAATIALLVMTAEDEQADGKLHARMNVVHEAGLFQGRLGFTRAIVLLEEGCEEFTNIQGLGQIRFPKGRISAVFEDVRLVLEREGILSAD